MKTIVLNSHSLSYYQKCPREYFLRSVQGLRPAKEKSVFRRGTLFSRFLAVYYYHKMRPASARRAKLLMNGDYWIAKFASTMEISDDIALGYYKTLWNYISHYSKETWVTLGTEVGFSILLYEDSDLRVIYEGRIDWVGHNGDNIIFPADHKTRTSKRDYIGFSNQPLGYCYATGARTFVFNYLTLTKVPTFERQVITYTQAQLDAWKANTVGWAKAIANDTEYRESLCCVNQFGKCDLLPICEQPKPEMKLFVIKASYIQQSYRSW